MTWHFWLQLFQMTRYFFLHLLTMTWYFWLRPFCISSNTKKKIFVKVHLPFVHQRLCKIILQNQIWFWCSSCSETKVGSISMGLLLTAPEVKLTKTIFCQCAIIFPSTQNSRMTFMIGGTSQEAWLIWLGPSLPSIYQIGRSYYSRTIWHRGYKIEHLAPRKFWNR